MPQPQHELKGGGTLRPGDLIEWVYTVGRDLVYADDMMWSPEMQSSVAIGGVHLLVSLRVGLGLAWWEMTWLPLGDGPDRMGLCSIAIVHTSPARPRRMTEGARGHGQPRRRYL